jgi:hypothetical protein
MNNTTAEVLIKGIENGTIKLIKFANTVYERISEYVWMYRKLDDGKSEGVMLSDYIIKNIKIFNENDFKFVNFYQFTMNDIMCTPNRIISPEIAEMMDSIVMHRDNVDSVSVGDGESVFTWYNVEGGDHWIEREQHFVDGDEVSCKRRTVDSVSIIETIYRIEYAKKEMQEKLNMFENSIAYSS